MTDKFNAAYNSPYLCFSCVCVCRACICSVRLYFICIACFIPCLLLLFTRMRTFLPNKYSVDGFWEEGTVVSYLPATEEEPMALWKIRLDTDASLANKDVGKCWKKARFQDLEEHELHEARRRFT